MKTIKFKKFVVLAWTYTVMFLIGAVLLAGIAGIVYIGVNTTVTHYEAGALFSLVSVIFTTLFVFTSIIMFAIFFEDVCEKTITKIKDFYGGQLDALAKHIRIQQIKFDRENKKAKPGDATPLPKRHMTPEQKEKLKADKIASKLQVKKEKAEAIQQAKIDKKLAELQKLQGIPGATEEEKVEA